MKLPLKTRKVQTPELPAETPAQMVKRVQAETDARRIVDAYNEERRQLDAKVYVETVAAVTSETIEAQTDRSKRNALIRERAVNYAPLVTISALAVIGQFGYFSTNLTDTFGPATFPIAALVALALESISLFLGYHAMRALQRKDSAAGLLISSVIVAGLVAYLNFTNFMIGGEPTHASFAFGIFSFTVPFLWRIKIRSDHRDELAANGEIDKRGLKLARRMWVFHPIKSYKVYRHAAWTGETDPTIAVKEWESTVILPTPTAEIPGGSDLDVLAAEIENIRRDLATEADEVPEVVAPVTRKAITASTDALAKWKTHAKWSEGVAKFTASLDMGQPMKQHELADELGMSNRVLASQIMQFVRTERGINQS